MLLISLDQNRILIKKKPALSFQIKVWFSVEGEKQLTPLESITLSVAKVKEMRESLEQFLEESVVNMASKHILMCNRLKTTSALLICVVLILTAPAEARPAAGQRLSGVSSRFSSP